MQLSVTIWIINYPTVMPFAANRQVGEIGGKGGQGGSMERGGGRLGHRYDFCGVATALLTIFALLLHIITMHDVPGSW